MSVGGHGQHDIITFFLVAATPCTDEWFYCSTVEAPMSTVLVIAYMDVDLSLGTFCGFSLFPDTDDHIVK